MRCVSCDDPLSALEMSRKSPVTQEEYDLCTECLKKAGLLVFSVENPLAEMEEDATNPDFYGRPGDQ